MSADLVPLREQASAEREILVRKNDASAAAPGGQRSHQPGWPGADHQHVAVRVCLLVVVGILSAGGPSEPRGAADQRLIQLLPERRRPHECLVVEAGRQHAARDGVERQQVEVQIGPAVLAPSVEAVEQLDRGRARGSRRAPVLSSTRAFGSSQPAVRTAWAMIFERAADERHAVGDQRRSERIAGEATHRAAIEAEFDRAGAVDTAAGRQAAGLAHGAVSPLPRDAASSVASTACVRDHASPRSSAGSRRRMHSSR